MRDPGNLRVLFLDMDGVLNTHERHSNGYPRTDTDLVYRLNVVLKCVPSTQVVVTSSWRYLVHSGSMTIRGLENLLLALGLEVGGKLLGVTCRDEEYQGTMPREEFNLWLQANGCQLRARQIDQWLSDYRGWLTWAVLDDMPVPVARLVQTHAKQGLAAGEAGRTMDMLRGLRWEPRPRCTDCSMYLANRVRCTGCGAEVPDWQVFSQADLDGRAIGAITPTLSTPPEQGGG